MKTHQPKSTRSYLSKFFSSAEVMPGSSRVMVAILTTIGLGILAAASVQAAPTTNNWIGGGVGSQWSTAANWSAGSAPGPLNFAVLTNTAATGLPGTNGMGAVGTPNITVTADTTVGQLAFCNTNTSNLAGSFHTIGINPGVTLTVSNIGSGLSAYQSMILPVMSCAGLETLFGGDGVNQWARGNLWTLYATIQGGAGSTLNVICTNSLSTWNQGNIMVENGTLNGGGYSEPLNATLDLSGLDNFNAYVNHLSVGADGAPTPFYAERPKGTLYLARTNMIVLWSVGTFPSEGTAGGNAGIWAGLIAQNNGAGTNHVSYIHLGFTNGIYCDTGIGLGIRGVSGAIDFNTNNAAGSSSVFFRNKAGTGRQSRWSLGDRTGTASEGQDVLGIMDFSRGTVDAMVSTLSVGNSGVNANRAIGMVSFGAGTIDVNSLLLGVQSSSGAGAAQGLITVSNSAVFKVNTSAQIGTLAGSTAGSFPYFGQILATNGGSVQFGNTTTITCGTATSEIDVANGSSLAVSTVGSPSAPLTTLTVVSNNTLTIDLGLLPNPSVAPVQVSTLNSAGTNTINLLGTGLIKGTITLIKYGTWNNDGSTSFNCVNFKMGTNSPGVVGYITNNPANNSIDFVVKVGTATSLVWNGMTNGVPVGNWDINITPDWQGSQKYTQPSIPGSFVQFDDTAAGTTSVSLITNMAPVQMIVTNSSLAYTFSGSGWLAGPGKLIKDGSASMTLNNTGTNANTGEIDINNGTLRIAGSDNRLPVGGSVVLVDSATASLDLNNFNQTLASISGGGTTGGNITQGSGNLTITGTGNYGGVISGSGSLIKTTGGTLVLNGANLYSGGTIVSNGSVLVANTTGSGLGSGSVLIAGGSLQLGDGLTANGSIAAPIITNNGSLNVLPNSDYTFTNLIVGSGSFNKLIGAGSGTIFVTNDNFYTGITSVGLGIVQISSSHALGSGQINGGNQTVQDTYLALSGGITVSNAINIPAKTGGIVPPVDHVKNVDGTNTLAGTISLGGATVFAIGSDSGLLVVTGPIVNSQVANPGRFFLRGAGDGIFQSAFNQGAGNPLELDKWDSGTWTLNGANTYSGLTYINEGKLVVNGSINNSSSLFVSFGSILAGSGKITAPVTNIGTVYPGDDGTIATLTVSNAFYCDAAASVVFDVNTNGNDSIRGITQATYGGTLKVNVLGTLTGACVFKLFDAANYTGAFGTLDLPDISGMGLGWDASYLSVDGTLHATNGVVVTPAITSARLSGGQFALSGAGTLVAPYSILATTNLSLPVASWVNLGGGTFSNGLFNFIDATATNYPLRFYRLSTPAP